MNMQETMRGLVERAGVKTVYGDPVTAGDVTIVPAAKIAYGLGGGESKRNREGRGKEESGGGGGYAGKPAGYIEISPSGTRWVPIGNVRRIAAALALGFVVGLVVGSRRRGV